MYEVNLQQISEERLDDLFYKNQDRLVSKWTNYFSVYERYFEKYRNKPVIILEIGVFQGGSLQMWKKYFGEGVQIYGIDIDPRCKSLEEDNITIFTGSQSDRQFLQSVKRQIPKVDILLDDGGHTMKQQIVTFEEMFEHIKNDGIYICEDCHTSYWPRYGGGYLRRGTFIEYSKKMIDKLNAWHFKDLPVDHFTTSVLSIGFYDSMVVIEKRNMKSPKEISIGKQSFYYAEKISFFNKVNSTICWLINVFLAKLKLPSIGV